jgi:hypothetical protein
MKCLSCGQGFAETNGRIKSRMVSNTKGPGSWLMGDSFDAVLLFHWAARRIRAMPAAVKLREDYSAEELRALAKRSKDAHQSRRLLSLAAVRDGMGRGEAAKIGGMDRQTLRDWVHRFNAAGPEGLIDNWTEGPKPRLSADQFGC